VKPVIWTDGCWEWPWIPLADILPNTSEYRQQHCLNIAFVQSYHLPIFSVAALSKQIG